MKKEWEFTRKNRGRVSHTERTDCAKMPWSTVELEEGCKIWNGEIRELYLRLRTLHIVGVHAAFSQHLPSTETISSVNIH